MCRLPRTVEGSQQWHRTDGCRGRLRAGRRLQDDVPGLDDPPSDPCLSLTNPIAEPLRATGRREEIPELATTVGLTIDLLARRPHEVSDGKLQRACPACALVLGPRWLICDEMTAKLDTSTTAALVTVVEDYRRTTGAGLWEVGESSVCTEARFVIREADPQGLPLLGRSRREDPRLRTRRLPRGFERCDPEYLDLCGRVVPSSRLPAGERGWGRRRTTGRECSG